MSLPEALAAHDRGLMLLTDGTKEMAVRGRKAIARFATGWKDFLPVEIWNAYRETGLERQGCLLGFAENHLLWRIGRNRGRESCAVRTCLGQRRWCSHAGTLAASDVFTVNPSPQGSFWQQCKEDCAAYVTDLTHEEADGFQIVGLHRQHR